MKFYITAICKNEEKHVERFLKAVENEIDQLYILDTGSTDQTVSLFKKHPKVVLKQINYEADFNFETARNDALAMINQDTETILFALDLDEIPRPGFSKIVKQTFANPQITRLRYRFNWLIENEIPKIFFNSEKIWRAGLGYTWRYLAHERLVPSNFEEIWSTVDITVDHFADHSKSRSNYLPLLEKNYNKYPDDPRSILYYGRELSFYSKWQEGLQILNKFIKLPNIWDAEKAYALRLIADCLFNLGDKHNALLNLVLASQVYNQSRDTYFKLCEYYYTEKQWGNLFGAAKQGLWIVDRPNDYMESSKSWGYALHDFASIGAYWIGLLDVSLTHALQALRQCPTDKRLQNNVQIIQKIMEL